MQDQEDGLLDEIIFASKGPGRPAASPLMIEVERPLVAEDVSEILDLPAAGGTQHANASPLQTIRFAHHQLARLVASGAPDTEISLLTGYTPVYVRVLKQDPTFQELLKYYEATVEKVFVDTLERMKVLGISTLEELQKRIDEEPDKWTKRELMELADLTLVKPMATRGAPAGGAPSGGVSVAISFVSPEGPKTIEGEVK